MITITYYTVSIASMSLPSPGTGFIDNIRPDHYGTDVLSPIPDTLANALDKGRAFIRWKYIQNEVSMNVSPVVVSNVTATGATPSAPATAFSFTLGYDRPDCLLTEDELNPGTTLTGAAAIKRLVARALTQTYNTKTVIVDPTNVWGIPKAAPTGERIVDIQVGPIANTIAAAESKITVSLIPNT